MAISVPEPYSSDSQQPNQIVLPSLEEPRVARCGGVAASPYRAPINPTLTPHRTLATWAQRPRGTSTAPHLEPDPTLKSTLISTPTHTNRKWMPRRYLIVSIVKGCEHYGGDAAITDRRNQKGPFCRKQNFMQTSCPPQLHKVQFSVDGPLPLDPPVVCSECVDQAICPGML